MCGLFGVLIPTAAPTAPRSPLAAATGEMVGMLGCLAEERGRDAAGIAVHRDDVWRVSKWHGRFSRCLDRMESDCAGSTAVIGHTRWATQGSRDLDNAGPIITRRLIGTHNGDIDPWTIPVRYPRRADGKVAGIGMDELLGSSDSRLLFAALDERAHRTGRGLSVGEAVALLEQVVGRAALVWAASADRRPRVWLARAGLSPLAVGRDVAGRLWWASNPLWLRQLDEEFGMGIEITLIPEGSIWAARADAARVAVRQVGAFKPTVRQSDVATAHRIVWRGFKASDTAADQQLLRHRTTPRPAPVYSHA